MGWAVRITRQTWRHEDERATWLTRNGHGAGFWDRGYGDVGSRLTDAAHVYGSVDLCAYGEAVTL